MTAPIVRVFGRVLLDQKPLQNLKVTFRPANAGPLTPKITAETDLSGQYEVRLPRPGVFQVAYERDGFGLLGNERQVKVIQGDNAVEWSLVGATLKIDVKGWDRATPVDVTVSHLDMTTPGDVSTGVRLSPADSLPLVINGIGFGQYSVQATAHSPTLSASGEQAGAVVTLSADHREAEITLHLDEHPQF